AGPQRRQQHPADLPHATPPPRDGQLNARGAANAPTQAGGAPAEGVPPRGLPIQARGWPSSQLPGRDTPRNTSLPVTDGAADLSVGSSTILAHLAGRRPVPCDGPARSHHVALACRAVPGAIR